MPASRYAAPMRSLALLVPLAALAACEPAGNEPGPGGVTVDEARALDEAAEMLEARRLPEEALPDAEGAPEETDSEIPPQQ